MKSADSIHGELCLDILVKFSDINVEKLSLFRVKIWYKFHQFLCFVPLAVKAGKQYCISQELHVDIVHLQFLHVVKCLFFAANVGQTLQIG